MESESDLLTRRPVDLFEKEPLKGKWEVNLHTPTKFGEDPSKDLGGNREHTNKRCSNYSMMMMFSLYWSIVTIGLASPQAIHLEFSNGITTLTLEVANCCTVMDSLVDKDARNNACNFYEYSHTPHNER